MGGGGAAATSMIGACVVFACRLVLLPNPRDVPAVSQGPTSVCDISPLKAGWAAGGLQRCETPNSHSRARCESATMAH